MLWRNAHGRSPKTILGEGTTKNKLVFRSKKSCPDVNTRVYENDNFEAEGGPGPPLLLPLITRVYNNYHVEAESGPGPLLLPC